MTDKFKKRVRERMAQTGETYTAARRALEAEREARPKLMHPKLDGLCDGCRAAIDTAALGLGLTIVCETCGRSWRMPKEAP